MTESIDSESVLSRALAIVQAGLNTKLLAIDALKNDGITLKPVASGAYAVVTMDSEVMNYDPFIYVGATQENGSGIGAGTDLMLIVDFVVVLLIEGGDTNVWKRLLRYQRALKELIQENFSDTQVPGGLYIESVEPRPLDQLGSKPYMGVGIRIKTSLS